MDTESFRRHGHEMVDWMADYLDRVETLPVRAPAKPGDIARQLPVAPPDTAEDMAAIFTDFKDIIVPGMTHWQHPSFFAYFPANSSPPAVLGEMLAATMGAQCMLWQTSPAATELETRMIDWLKQMTGLPANLTGMIQDSASSATLCAMLRARERATGGRANRTGLTGEAPLVAYCSAEAHSSIEKGAKIAGFGADQVRAIPVDESYAMRADVLAETIEADRRAGRRPVCVVACLGGTGVGANDPLREIGEICRREDIFLHVDAAWAGSFLLLPECRRMLDGVEFADSFVFNPHKILLSGLECTAFYVRDPDDYVRTFANQPAYLTSREGDQVIDYRDWGVQLGRRFRALRLWLVIRSYGVEGLQAMLRQHLELAAAAEAWVREAADFELVTTRNLSLFNFRYHPAGLDDEARLAQLNRRLLEQLNDSGEVYFTQNEVDGRYTIRWSIGQRQTELRHVEAAWQIIQQTARTLPIGEDEDA